MLTVLVGSTDSLDCGDVTAIGVAADSFWPSTDVVGRLAGDRLADVGLPRFSTVAIPGRPGADFAVLGDIAAVTGRPAGSGDAKRVFTGGLQQIKDNTFNLQKSLEI